MKKIVTFGEIMLRLQPPGHQRFLQADSFDAEFGGGEANVAVCLANLGDHAAFVTKLPAHAIGQACLNAVRKWGVDTSHIVRGGSRLGIYFCEKGASQRPSNVIYDRAASAIAEIGPDEIDWQTVLKDADWFHFTGITPALSDNACACLKNALAIAKKNGVTVSCDLNYRKKLWSKQKAGIVMGELMPYVDVLIANEEDCKDVFSIEAEGTDIEGGSISRAGYKNVLKQLTDRFGFRYAAITLRESFSASKNGWSAVMTDGKDFYESRRYEIDIIDRVGGGDSFGAGLIHSLVNGKQPQDALEYAVACSCLKHTIEGDFNPVSDAEVTALIQNGGSGRVNR